MSWAEDTPEGTRLLLRVVPRAARDGVAGEQPDALRVRLNAPPVDGKANAALVRYLAGALGVRPSAVTLEHGHGARLKTVTIQGLDAAAVRKRLCGQSA